MTSLPSLVPAIDSLVLGVDVGGTTIKAEITDAQGRVLARRSGTTPSGPAALDAIGEVGDEAVSDLPDEHRHRLARAAVVVPGIVDRVRGVAVFSANIGWRDLPVTEALAEHWHVPVLVDHDVTLAGWAEWRLGAGRGCDDLCFVALGTGVASAHVAAGRLLRGGLGGVGELGHLPVRRGGRRCPCGAHGCVETLASAASIARAYTERTDRPVTGAEEVVARRDVDAAAREVWDEAVAALADGLLPVAYLLSPTRIVLGGGLSQAGEVLTTAVQQALTARIQVTPVPTVVVGEFGPRAGVVGATLLARAGGTEDTR